MAETDKIGPLWAAGFRVILVGSIGCAAVNYLAAFSPPGHWEDAFPKSEDSVARARSPPDVSAVLVQESVSAL